MSESPVSLAPDGVAQPDPMIDFAELDAQNCKMFGGRPPLDLVTSGSQDGLLVVRRFLDGARGGLYMQPNIIDEAFAPYDAAEIVFR
jgi:Protein of unknown function (DUF2384)